MPKNASISADGFRVYRWDGGDGPLHHKYSATEPADLLSVTSIRTICGTPYQLVNWQINNVVTLATGSRKTEWRDYSKSTRGRKVEGYKADGPFPGEFVTRMLDIAGPIEEGVGLAPPIPEDMTELRKWLRSTAEQPRDIAAVRGSVVHKLVETNHPQELLGKAAVRQRFDLQWEEEKVKIVPDVTDEDIAFAIDTMQNYYDMRVNVPFVILAQEVQVFNLTAGYAGSADVLLWFLPEGTPLNVEHWQAAADKGDVTLAMIKEVGGTIAVGDWKTSPKVYTSHVVQTQAYMAGEFIATDGRIDERLTEMLLASRKGLVIKLRPDGWEVDIFPLREDVLTAFFGSVALARFLTFYKEPEELFEQHLTGIAAGIEPTEVLDD